MLRSRNSSILTAVTLVALACALAGCGRKAGLDLPPGASNYQPAPEDVGADQSGSAATAKGDLYSSGTTNNIDKGPVAPRGPKKRIILDPILD